MATSTQKSASVIERKAINSSGRLGSLYDACRDRIIEKSSETFQKQQFSVSKVLQCYLINGDSEDSNNLLRCVDIQDELRINVLLKLKKRSGTATVIEHPHYIDKYTRFLYYYWIACEHRLQSTPDIRKMKGIWQNHNSATHIITSLKIGIDVIFVLQLPPETVIADKIDFLLNKICDLLSQDKNNVSQLSLEENSILEHIISTNVYSNISSLTALDSVSHILQHIDAIKKDAARHCPVSYTLQTISSLYPSLSMKTALFRPLSDDLKYNIEEQMLQCRSGIKRIDLSLKKNPSTVKSRHTQQPPNGVHSQFEQVKKKYVGEMHRFSKLVVDVRSNRIDTSKIQQAFSAAEYVTLQNNISKLVRMLPDLKIEGRSITNAQQQQSESRNAAKHNLDKNNNRTSIDSVSTNNSQRNPVVPSKTTSKENKPEQSQKLQRDLNNGHKHDSDSQLINSDLRYDASESLNNMSLSTIKTNNDYKDSRSLPLIHGDFPVISSSPSKVPSDEFVNILLLGETGVGKSTFINAFANYLTFNSLEQAESNEPIVVIPVSFIMTTGDNFEEHTIKFGEFDDLNNEDFNHPGQSVTQHCKSYVFNLHQIDGKQLRIIDTPGFGDTRGLDQDDRNMEHILQYINNLTHLNAICFLLKPNTSRLNIFFRTCLTQLFSFLNPDARKNIIFCFSNARSTFYTPGDTAPLLKNMLSSLSISDIQFKKENTFCFDSESFRYLVALRNSIPFNDDEKNEYDKSWTTSVKESNRLINHINTKHIAYRMENGWQSSKHAQFEISYMIRPMLETIRNILRNRVLCKKNLSTELIELHPKPLHRTGTRCCSCMPNPQQVGKFWIILITPNEIHDDGLMCSCAPDQHISVDYTLEYKISNSLSKFYQEQANATLSVFCEACAEFAHFLIHVACSTKTDPFSIGFEEMIVEEKSICNNQKLTDFNRHLIEELTKYHDLYKQQIIKTKSNKESMKLPNIYKLIKIIGEYPLVQEQMVAVKKTQQSTMEEYEYEVEKI